MKKLIYKLIDHAGYGELLVVSGLFFALVAGYEFFYSVDLKGDLGALIFGNCNFKSSEVKSASKIFLFSFKELMLVGFSYLLECRGCQPSQ